MIKSISLESNEFKSEKSIQTEQNINITHSHNDIKQIYLNSKLNKYQSYSKEINDIKDKLNMTKDNIINLIKENYKIGI